MPRTPLYSSICLIVASAMKATLAATITVSPSGAISTIQAGVDAASAGDTVVVKAGIYQENVLIDGLNDLTLRASGKVTIEARPAGGAGGGPGIRVINSDGVKIDGFIVRNAADHPSNGTQGIGIDCTGADHTVEDCTVVECEDEGILVTGAGARVDDCLCTANGSGLTVAGADAVIVQCETRDDGDAGIVLTGDDGLISKCKINGVEDDIGIDVSGNRVRVEKCSVTNTCGVGIDIDGSDAEVLKCTVRAAASGGIEIDGANAVVDGNTVECTGGAGIDVAGADAVVDDNKLEFINGNGIDTDGDNPTITDNELEHTIDDDEGIEVSNAPTGGLIEGNTVLFASQNGIDVEATCSNFEIRDNVVRFSCFEEEAGFNIAGSGHTLEDNKAQKNGGDGFNLRGANHVLRNNTASDNTRDGFDIDNAMANGITLDDNVAKANGAEGIENNGTNSIVTDNVAQKNRIDVANDGSFATFDDNTFTTGGDMTTPEID